ncbi:MAG: hypothetical protein ACK5RG_16395 [Cyclobacteriaceae bacterium]|jgi:hypothetical protein|nr:hypothetical protein [Flammeovirgaceae bacterium]
MKTPLILIVLVFFTISFSFGQECEKQTDPFSNEKVTTFEWKAGGIRTLFMESRNGKSTLEFRVGEIGAIEYTISAGSDVQIKLENGEIIKMHTLFETKSVVSSTSFSESSNVVSSTYFMKTEITNEQLKKLATSKVTHMQFPDLHGGLQTYSSKELRNKFERFLMEGAKCLTENN